MAKQEIKEEQKGFDLRTHLRNKDGHIETVQPYRAIFEGDKLTFERPPGSGNIYDAQNNLLKKGEAKAKPQISDEEAAEKLAVENVKLSTINEKQAQELDKLKKELEELKVLKASDKDKKLSLIHI